MFALSFLIAFNYNLLKNLKDALIIPAEQSGAEVIPFLKVWAMLPGAILLSWGYARLSARRSRETVFYVIVGGFILYFLVFLICYPYHEALELKDSSLKLAGWLPKGLGGLVAMYRHWFLTTFYVMGEMWSNIVFAVLFWGFANEVTRLSEAKRYYGLLGVIGNFSGVVSGQMAVWVGSWEFREGLGYGATAWDQIFGILLFIVIAVGVLILVTFVWMHKRGETECVHEETEEEVKPHMGFGASLKYVFRSRYLLRVATMVLAYNMIINVVEVIWKHHLKIMHPDHQSYNHYLSEVTIWVGVAATLSALFVSGNLVRRFGWLVTALSTPLILVITSASLFTLVLFPEWFESYTLAWFGMPVVGAVVFLGAVQNVLSRAAKYTVFDTSKEMTFLPLGRHERVRGKVAIDGVCSRMGKSGGAVIYQVLLVSLGSMTLVTGYLAVLIFPMFAVWIASVRSLAHSHGVAEVCEREDPSLLTKGRGQLREKTA